MSTNYQVTEDGFDQEDLVRFLVALGGLIGCSSTDKYITVPDAVTLSGELNLEGVGIVISGAACSRALDIQITPTTADRQLYMDINYGANAKEAAYIISSSTKTSGETTALRARGQGKAAGPSTAEIRGVHAQGIAFEALYAGTVNAIYAEAIAKGTSTVTTIRGAMIACDSEGTPTSIGTMYGAEIRVKTSVAPSAYSVLVLTAEKFGAGVACDAAILIRDTTWGAAETPYTVGIHFNATGITTTGVHFDSPVATGITFDNAGTTRAINIQITPTTADRQLYMSIDYGANAKEAAYIICSSAVTSGESSAIRARGQAQAAGASTAEMRGIHAQGISIAAKYAGTVNALYAEAIAKDTTTVVTIRGAMIACDSEGTPTSITTMYGAHIRVKTSVAPTTLIGCVIETEKFGAGVKANALLDLRSTTWGAGEEAVTAIIDMSNFGAKASHAHIRFPIAGAMDNDSTVEGDFWYDSAGHVFKYRDNAGVKTVTSA